MSTTQLSGSSVAPFADNLHPLLPEQAIDASDAFAAALEAQGAARAELRLAEGAVKAAGREDRHASEAAALEGTAAPKPTAPSAVARVDQAQRTLDGTRAAAITRRDQYLAVIREARGEITAAAESRLTQIEAETAANVASVETALSEGAYVRRLLRELGDGTYLAGRSPQFQPSPVGKAAGRDPLKGSDARAAIDELRVALGAGR
jgi:hypothetical protein